MERNMLPTELVLKYSKFTREMFDFLVNNVLNSCFSKQLMLNIVTFDVNDKKIGDCLYPNQIIIYIGDIICLFSIEDLYYKSDECDNCIKTIITDTIGHEILHANRMMDMVKYNIDKSYYDKEERMVERQIILILMNHKSIIEETFKFSLKIEFLSDITPGPYTNNGYCPSTIESYYLMRLCNLFPSERSTFETIFKKYKTIILYYKNDPNIISREIRLRSNGIWNESCIDNFQELFCIQKYLPYESWGYRLSIGEDTRNRTTVFINIEANNKIFHPMVLKQE